MRQGLLRDAILEEKQHLILEKVDTFMYILGVHLPLLGAAQPVVDGRLPLGRRVGIHQAAAQQHLGAAKGRKIGKVEVVLSGHARSGKIAGQGIQHRTALHLGQQAGRQQCQSALFNTPAAADELLCVDLAGGRRIEKNILHLLNI